MSSINHFVWARQEKASPCLEGSARSFPMEQPHNDFSKQTIMD